MRSEKARKQRKYLFNAPLHKKRKWLASHLQENLLLKYDRRSIPVIKGDTVKILRGNFKGHEDKISHVNVKDQYVEIEGVTHIKADGKKIAKPIHASDVLITKLNLTDNWRRKTLEKGLTEETKKEIEREAQEQLKDREEQKKKDEEAKKEEERVKEEKETPSETPDDEKPSTKKSETPPETPQKKPQTVEKKPVKKTLSKKSTPKKEKTEAKP